MRRGAMRPPWSHLLSSCAVCASPACSRSSAARFCDALGPAADALRLPSPWREDLKPPRGRASDSFFLPDFLLAIGRWLEELVRTVRLSVLGSRLTSASRNGEGVFDGAQADNR